MNVANTGDATAPLGTVVVNLYYGDDETPAPPVHGPNGADLPADVAAGATVSGAYIFTVPADDRDRVRIEECRPLSKDKHFRLIEIIEKAR